MKMIIQEEEMMNTLLWFSAQGRRADGWEVKRGNGILLGMQSSSPESFS